MSRDSRPFEFFRIGVDQGISEMSSNLRRSLLSVASIALGVCAVMVINSLTRGNQDQTLRNISRMGGVEILSVSSVLPHNRDQKALFGRSSGLTYTQFREIAARVPEVEYLLPEVWMPNRTVADRNGTRPADLLSVDWEYFNQFDLSVAPIGDGKGLSAPWKNGDPVCLVGAELAANVIVKGDSGMAFIRFAGSRLRVAGIVDAREYGDWRQRVIFVPWSLYLKTVSGPNARLDAMNVKIRKAEMMPAAARKTKALLVHFHRGVPDFVIHTPEEEIAARNRANRILTLIGNFIAGLALSVGGIGILNLMWSTVNNRIREIGVRKAIGASNQSILFQFLAEAVTISSSGTCIGLALGALPLLLPEGSLPVTPHQTPLDFLICGGVGTALGLLAGLYPALVASRCSPVEALAHA